MLAQNLHFDASTLLYVWAIFSRIRAIFKIKGREKDNRIDGHLPSVARNNIHPQVCNEIEDNPILVSNICNKYFSLVIIKMS